MRYEVKGGLIVDFTKQPHRYKSVHKYTFLINKNSDDSNMLRNCVSAQLLMLGKPSLFLQHPKTVILHIVKKEMFSGKN